MEMEPLNKDLFATAKMQRLFVSADAEMMNVYFSHLAAPCRSDAFTHSGTRH